MSLTVLIFAKPPWIGVSKTRLARSLGAVEARRIARWTMARTLQAACHSKWHTVLYVAPDAALNETLGGLWPLSLPRVSQGRGSLTDRLGKGLREAAPGPLLFIGSDAPDISTALIAQAFRALRTHDAVFGPASDGGFWLFGLKKVSRTVSPFENVRWSGPHAMADVKHNLGDMRLAQLPMLLDIDDAEDWAAWHKAR